MHIVIIGNGIAGITAARVIRKASKHRITIISGETPFFYSRTALMYVYMRQMRFEDIKPYEDWFWEKNKFELVHAWVDKLEPDLHRLILDDGTSINFDKLLIATGSKPNKFNWPGQDLDGVQGLYSIQDLEGMEYHSQNLNRAVIVGGGLIGIEMAEMFLSRDIPVTFLVREGSYWDMVLPKEESAMVNRHILEHNIDLKLGTELREIWGDIKLGKVKAVATNKGEIIQCGFVGLTAGVSPNIDFLHFSGLALDKGVIVNKNLQTNLPDIFAAGDCAQLQEPDIGRQAIEAVWYFARMMGENAGRNILASIESQSPVPYEPGIWFNSAKFLDIEYQVYGSVLPDLPDSQSSIFWEHPDGRKSIRVVYNRKDESVIGFLLMGIRYRHEICEKWIKEKTHIEEVIRHLGIANFDPEFYPQYEQEIVNEYNKLTGKSFHLETRRSPGSAWKFLKKINEIS